MITYQSEYKELSPFFSFGLFFLFIFLFYLSRKGFFNIASYFFISIYSLLGTYIIWRWGIEVPAGILFYALNIIMAGVLISTRFAFKLSIIFFFLMFFINYLQTSGTIPVDLLWQAKNDSGLGEIIAILAVYIIIVIVSWLSNRETERSLRRARKSEAELKKEKDLLEIRVEERTEELKKAQMEKITELSKLAEFGRLSSGLFHDLANPLTAISLNIEKIKNTTEKQREFQEIETDISKAKRATERMKNFIEAVRKQFANQDIKNHFSLDKEIEEVIQIFSYKAKKKHIQIILNPHKELIVFFGNPIKFSQIVANLIGNAIDSYEHKENIDPQKKAVIISLEKKEGDIVITIRDFGSGIPEKIKPKIFDPFFTTKEFSKGTGLGLSLIKNIIEKEFDGTITVESTEGEGSIFTVILPQIMDN